jgi:Transglycosylase-like domain
MRGDGGGARRRHLSPGTRAALARTRLIEVVPAGPSRLHSSAPPRSDEPPVVLHPLWAPVHARRADRTDTRGPLHRAHVLHPSAPPRRGPRPGRRPRPVVPFDIPVEAFAVEVGGGAHPSVRSLGDRRLVYVEHRIAVRRAYRRRQLVFAVGLSGAFVVVSVLALAPTGHAGAAVAGPRASDRAHSSSGAPDGSAGSPTSGTVSAATPSSPRRPIGPPPVRARRSSPRGGAVVAAMSPVPEDRDERRITHGFGAGSGRSLVDDPFLVCTRGYESIYAGGYEAIGSNGLYRGAYQFDQVTWDGTARHVDRFDLVGASPDLAPPAIQDFMAYSLYEWQGGSHWHDRCAGLP